MGAFVLEDGAVYHTYSSYARGLDGLWGMYQWLGPRPQGAQRNGPLVAPPRRVTTKIERPSPFRDGWKPPQAGMDRRLPACRNGMDISMRKLIAGMKISVDGKMEGPEGYADWVEAWSEDYGLTE
jgi:hypothetical protein